MPEKINEGHGGTVINVECDEFGVPFGMPIIESLSARLDAALAMPEGLERERALSGVADALRAFAASRAKAAFGSIDVLSAYIDSNGDIRLRAKGVRNTNDTIEIGLANAPSYPTKETCERGFIPVAVSQPWIEGVNVFTREGHTPNNYVQIVEDEPKPEYIPKAT